MPELAKRLLARDRDAVSEALNLIDDRRPAEREAALTMLAAVERGGSAGGAYRIGITGAPGAGKSTLLDACVRELRAADATVGIIAVDPSSQRSGGALLGDRFRMRSSARDPGVFVRSMAARERLGGLADATHAGIEILASVFDYVFVETVGVGQSEGDVARQVDTTIFVAQPGAGDMLQFMKAGVLELPDVFVVNKADLGAVAERTASELSAGLGLGESKSSGWKAPVLMLSARDGTGIDEMLSAAREHRTALEKSKELQVRRADARASYVSEALTRRFGSYGVERIGGSEALQTRIRDACRSEGASAFELLSQLADEIEVLLADKPETSTP
ncbi:MAG: methylmalonyl Co-A mutase-associated GTPase MeaB [Myxococcota bacterium]|nr:methylmalonyl Co-A mutase-associated GTPase MeaB [Myxococcota bacterium]